MNLKPEFLHDFWDDTQDKIYLSPMDYDWHCYDKVVFANVVDGFVIDDALKGA